MTRKANARWLLLLAALLLAAAPVWAQGNIPKAPPTLTPAATTPSTAAPTATPTLAYTCVYFRTHRGPFHAGQDIYFKWPASNFMIGLQQRVGDPNCLTEILFMFEFAYGGAYANSRDEA